MSLPQSGLAEQNHRAIKVIESVGVDLLETCHYCLLEKQTADFFIVQ